MNLESIEVFDEMPFFFWAKDESGKYIFGNQTINLYAGESIIGKYDQDLIWGNDADALLENDSKVFASGQPVFTQEKVERSSSGKGATFSVYKWLGELDGIKCCFGLSFIID